jgi:uncharacterized Ntn-hydrolase superfamily protein
MTFSLTARCPNTGAFGVAISSSSIAVASRCAWPDAFGAVTSQNLTNPALGLTGQKLLRQGLGAAAVLDLLLKGDPDPAWRQLAVIDRFDRVAWHSGTRALPECAVATHPGVVAMGNLLANSAIPEAMLKGFEAASGAPLAERLMCGLEAGLVAGGETAPVRSAGVKVCRTHDWPVVDLRVDWHDAPIAELRALWIEYAPQEATFIQRARDPSGAGFGAGA